MLIAIGDPASVVDVSHLPQVGEKMRLSQLRMRYVTIPDHGTSEVTFTQRKETDFLYEGKYIPHFGVTIIPPES